MLKYEKYADSRHMTREEWLKARRSGIGGSDAGAIMGVSPYRGPFAVWADKHGYESGDMDSEAMRQGRDLEDYVAKRFAEKTGRKVLREHGMLRSKAHPCMVANIDRKIASLKAGLECKTSKDLYMKRWRDGDLPMEYYCQCLHYMAVTGWRPWYLCAVIHGTPVLVYTISRGPRKEERGVDYYIDNVQDEIDALVEAEEAFWRDYVDGGQTPPPDGLTATTEALGRVYSRSEEMCVESTYEDDVAVERLIELKREKRRIEREIREAENGIKGSMKEAQELRASAALVTWKPQKRRTISVKKLKEAYPDIDISRVQEESETRRFSVWTEDEDE